MHSAYTCSLAQGGAIALSGAPGSVTTVRKGPMYACKSASAIITRPRIRQLAITPSRTRDQARSEKCRAFRLQDSEKLLAHPSFLSKCSGLILTPTLRKEPRRSFPFAVGDTVELETRTVFTVTAILGSYRHDLRNASRSVCSYLVTRGPIIYRAILPCCTNK